MAKSKRSSLTRSKLAAPTAAIHALAAKVGEYIYYPDPGPLYLVLGTVAGNMLVGSSPVWVMLIGAPSSGRTLILDTLIRVPRVHTVEGITGPGALLSASGKKDRTKQSTGGLLNRVGLRGLILMKDFTDVLSMAPEPMKAVIGGFRGAFDGRWSRESGVDGGSKVHWGEGEPGRIGFLGASTQKLDQYHSIIQELGQRWLYYRFPNTDGFGETMSSLSEEDYKTVKSELCELIVGFFDLLDLDWDSHKSRVLTRLEKTRLWSMAALMTRVRTSVSRDFKTREIDEIAMPEGTPRMSGELGQLLRGLEHIGLGEDEFWPVIEKVALDSAPMLRVAVVKALEEGGGGGLTMAELRAAINLGKGKTTMDRCVEELGVLNVVVKVEQTVMLTAWSKELLKAGWVR